MGNFAPNDSFVSKKVFKSARWLARWIDRFTESLGKLAAWLVLVLVLVGTWNVVGRYVGRAIGQNLTSNTLLELQWYLFTLVFMLGAPYTLKRNEHVRVDLIYKGLSKREKAWVNLLGSLLFLIPFSGLIIYFSWSWTLNSWLVLENSSDAGGLPRYPIKSLIIISFGLLIFQGFSEAVKSLVILGEGPGDRARISSDNSD
ncbi:MAG: TRAP transporter small permease subunit [Cyanobacteria bacterium P01_C01_bin.89]